MGVLGLLRAVKGMRFLPFLQTNRLACHSFINAYRRYETSQSETKDFSTHSTAGSVSFMSVLVPLPSKFHGLGEKVPVYAVNVVGLHQS